MTRYLVVHPDGRIDHERVTTPEIMAYQVIPEGCTYVEADDDAITRGMYLVDGALTQRPALDLAEAYTLAKGGTLSLTLPAGTVVSVEGVGSETVADGTFVFEGDVPDTYRATVSLWPYLDKTLAITVTEATP